MKIINLKDVSQLDLMYVLKKLRATIPWEDADYFDPFLDKDNEYANCYFIKDDDSKIMGFMTIYESEYYTLDNIMVMKDFRKNGVATKLLNYFAKHLSLKDEKDIVLQVNTVNSPAIICYLKFGFTIDGMWNGFYEFYGKKRNKDALIMRYRYNTKKEDN